MGRGFVWGVYVDDVQQLWALRVDEDYSVDPDRGWSDAAGLELPPLPRGWIPRRVYGLDESGRRQEAVIAHVGAALWTGDVQVFVIEGTDGSQYAVDVLGRLQERSYRS